MIPVPLAYRHILEGCMQASAGLFAELAEPPPFPEVLGAVGGKYCPSAPGGGGGAPAF